MLLATVAGGDSPQTSSIELLARDDVVGVQQQDGEQRALLDPTEHHRAVVLGHLERAKKAKVHSLSKRAAPTVPAPFPREQPPAGSASSAGVNRSQPGV